MGNGMSHADMAAAGMLVKHCSEPGLKEEFGRTPHLPVVLVEI